jgi:hypothetical protein
MVCAYDMILPAACLSVCRDKVKMRAPEGDKCQCQSCRLRERERESTISRGAALDASSSQISFCESRPSGTFDDPIPCFLKLVTK